MLVISAVFVWYFIHGVVSYRGRSIWKRRSRTV